MVERGEKTTKPLKRRLNRTGIDTKHLLLRLPTDLVDRMDSLYEERGFENRTAFIEAGLQWYCDSIPCLNCQTLNPPPATHCCVCGTNLEESKLYYELMETSRSVYATRGRFYLQWMTTSKLLGVFESEINQLNKKSLEYDALRYPLDYLFHEKNNAEVIALEDLKNLFERYVWEKRQSDMKNEDEQRHNEFVEFQNSMTPEKYTDLILKQMGDVAGDKKLSLENAIYEMKRTNQKIDTQIQRLMDVRELIMANLKMLGINATLMDLISNPPQSDSK